MSAEVSLASINVAGGTVCSKRAFTSISKSTPFLKNAEASNIFGVRLPCPHLLDGIRSGREPNSVELAGGEKKLEHHQSTSSRHARKPQKGQFFGQATAVAGQGEPLVTQRLGA